MHTLDCTPEELTQALDAFSADTRTAIRSAPTSVLIMLINPITLLGLTQDATELEDFSRKFHLDLTRLTKNQIEALMNKLMIVVGTEIDRRFPVPA